MEQKEEIIFAARAYIDYDSPYETDYLSLIKETYPGAKIIELPKLDELHESKSAMFGVALLMKEKKHFFILIDSCDIFVYAPIDSEFTKDGSKRPKGSQKGDLSEGVKDEVLHALSIGKPTYKLIGDRLKRIKSISDDEELIIHLVLLNKKYKILDQFPKMKQLIKTDKRLNVHPRYVDFLFRNKKVQEIMKGFLSPGKDHEDSVRPITFQYRYPVHANLIAPVRYVPLNYQRKTLETGSNNILLTFDSMNKNTLLRQDREGEPHFYECFFDKTVLDAKKVDMGLKQAIEKFLAEGGKGKFEPNLFYDEHITGIGLDFDIDMPKGASIFLKKWWPEAMALKDGVVAYAHEDLDLKCIVSITGKGLNVSCEPYWFDERDDNFYDFKDRIEDDIDYLNQTYGSVLKCRTGRSTEGNGIKIDNSAITWAIYKKLLFSYSAKQYRITIPISKEEDDREWVDQISDVDNFLSNETKNVDEVVSRSNIDKDKWW